ncbi:MAG: hypothetical protein JRF34_00160 [Deltaproteobacteria bacterium]|nr:hypothetical protein [Deltaproteobacteria bacterium]
MNTDISFHDCLRHWKDVHTPGAENKDAKGVHLSSEDIYRMAEPEGIEKSPRETIEHLSLCPRCLSKWAEWLKAINAVADLEVDEGYERNASPQMSYGLLKAAATEGPKDPLSLRSACGRFALNLLPQMDNPEKGMVTLETAGSAEADLEGCRILLRDANGLVILEGKLRHGRLARLCENISGIDLNTWTIVVQKEEE